MALARLAPVPAGYEIQTATQRLVVFLTPRGPVFELGFRGPWGAGKGKLIQKLIAKQFDPVIPRIRIRLRRAR